MWVWESVGMGNRWGQRKRRGFGKEKRWGQGKRVWVWGYVGMESVEALGEALGTGKESVWGCEYVGGRAAPVGWRRLYRAAGERRKLK
jgi:hypothetical protein